MIVIDKLVKKYEYTIAVNGLSLEVKEGELFGLLGPNGAGKTTTINVLCGLLKPTSGSVSVGGYDVTKESFKIKELIGVCPQDTAVYSYLTGRENVELFGNLHTMPKDKIKKNSDELLNKLGLLEDANRRAGRYSGGIRRRLNIAMALVQDPKIVFLDEPTVGMDVQSRHAVWDFLRELKKRRKTIILTTHYMEEAEELCDRVGIIDHGKLIALGSPKQLKDDFRAKNLEEVFINLTGRSIRSE
ncbi:MAG: ATP-binding cassette domain-containing protein [archaeon]|nr:ATP-binding cassette domain-containing protein [archaeon]MCP8314548.1 ATP-binding cassette domain-containing protein [archaeon]MCP8318030.1 ATP-binding cassette domain-containing protein [archaeon]MCP8321284.1 ATP-binding cassette domain-containing protein [archaeon]